MTNSLRITKKNDYREVYNKGTVFKNRELVLWKLKKEKFGKTRIGYSVGKRFGTAVERNRAKRLLKEVYRLNKGNIKEGYDLVVVARGALKRKSFSEAESSFLNVLSKAGQLKK